MSFTVSQNGAPARSVEITQQTPSLTPRRLSGTSIRSNNDLKAVLEQALSDAGISGIDVGFDGSGNVAFSSIGNFTVGGALDAGTDTIDVTDLGLSATDVTTSSASAGATSVADIDIGSLTGSAKDLATIANYLQIVDDALTDLTTASTKTGSVSSRITSQTTFVKALIDANTSAVGTLVDANMEEESTKLKALQTQQQLAVQSLSIANSSTQNILVLFRQ